MQLQLELVKKLIVEVKYMYSCEVIIVDIKGMIIVGINEVCVGCFYEGVLICVCEKWNVIIMKEDEKWFEGVKVGLNFFVFLGYEVIGVFGLIGNFDDILFFGELFRKMIELFIKEMCYMEEVQWCVRMFEFFMVDWLQLKEWFLGFIEKVKFFGVDLYLYCWIIFI